MYIETKTKHIQLTHYTNFMQSMILPLIQVISRRFIIASGIRSRCALRQAFVTHSRISYDIQQKATKQQNKAMKVVSLNISNKEEGNPG